VSDFSAKNQEGRLPPSARSGLNFLPEICPAERPAMTRERLYLFDTTLRDGQQTQGVQFSATEKVQIARALDRLGVDYIEGGWPGANPTDSEFFRPCAEAARHHDRLWHDQADWPVGGK